MNSLRELGRMLLVMGGLLALTGSVLFFCGRLPFRLGRLPGDVIHKGENTTFYFPITTSIVISAGLSLLLWLIGRMRR